MNKTVLHQPRTLLGGLSAAAFLRNHWQKKPLLVRQAIADFKPIVSRAELFEMAQTQGVESRLVTHRSTPTSNESHWSLKHGPLSKKDFPKISQKAWTLLVQGVNLHDDKADRILREFDFISRARLDDLMISWASDQGGVGPHFDRYDVFLLQAQGTRRWRIGQNKTPILDPDAPLRILQNFQHSKEYLLQPGDMLYLPPQYAHEGVAMGECQTYSIGFRSPQAKDLTQELLSWMSEGVGLEDWKHDRLYQDPNPDLGSGAGKIPSALQNFARQHFLKKALDEDFFHEALGVYLSEPKAHVYFDEPQHCPGVQALVRRWQKGSAWGVELTRQTQMLYDEKRFYINAESIKASGVERMVLMRLSNERQVLKEDLDAWMRRLSPEGILGLVELFQEWAQLGWVRLVLA